MPTPTFIYLWYVGAVSLYIHALAKGMKEKQNQYIKEIEAKVKEKKTKNKKMMISQLLGLPEGAKFVPKDHEVINLYLIKQVRGQPLGLPPDAMKYHKSVYGSEAFASMEIL